MPDFAKKNSWRGCDRCIVGDYVSRKMNVSGIHRRELISHVVYLLFESKLEEAL